MCSAGPLLAAALLAAGPDPAALLRAADAPRHALEEGIVRVRALVREQDGPAEESSLDVFVKGDERALCIFRSGKQTGRRVLLVGERAWILVPTSKRAIAVSPGQRLLGGASIADVARISFAREFQGTLAGEETIDGAAHWVVALRAAARSAPYASGRLWIREDDSLPTKALLALSSGKPAKELSFRAYGRERGRTVLRRMEIRHLLASEHGLTTTLEFVEYAPARVGDRAFDPAGARDVP